MNWSVYILFCKLRRLFVSIKHIYDSINREAQVAAKKHLYPPPYQPRIFNHPRRPPLNQPQSPSAAQPIPNTTLNTNQNTNRGRNFSEKKPVEFTPIPVLYANLLPYLLNNAMVAITPAKVPQPPFFQGYNSNTTCAYHGGVLGHSIEHCMTLKHKVQNLIDAGWLKFEEDYRL